MLFFIFFHFTRFTGYWKNGYTCLGCGNLVLEITCLHVALSMTQTPMTYSERLSVPYGAKQFPKEKEEECIYCKERSRIPYKICKPTHTIQGSKSSFLSIFINQHSAKFSFYISNHFSQKENNIWKKVNYFYQKIDYFIKLFLLLKSRDEIEGFFSVFFSLAKFFKISKLTLF